MVLTQTRKKHSLEESKWKLWSHVYIQKECQNRVTMVECFIKYWNIFGCLFNSLKIQMAGIVDESQNNTSICDMEGALSIDMKYMNKVPVHFKKTTLLLMPV